MGKELESKWKTKIEKTMGRMETPALFFSILQMNINTEDDICGVTAASSSIYIQ